MRNHEVAWAAAEALEAMEKARRAKEVIAAEMRARGLELLPVEGHPTRRAWQRPPGHEKRTGLTPPTPPPSLPESLAEQARQDLMEQRKRELGAQYDRLLSDLVSAVQADPSFARKVIDAVRDAASERVDPAQFDRDFEGAYDAFMRNQQFGSVDILKMRRALPQYSREVFDRELARLRKEERFYLQTMDGRHRQPTPEEKESAIEDRGEQWYYVKRWFRD